MAIQKTAMIEVSLSFSPNVGSPKVFGARSAVFVQYLCNGC